MSSMSEGLLPSDPDELSKLAHKLAGEGKVREALNLCQDSSNQKPELADIHLYMGHALAALHQNQGAEAAYRTAVAALPTRMDAMLPSVIDFDERIRSRSKTSEMNPKSAPREG
jgi:thioredoxin-like negative regulator of GroEL